MHFVRELLHNIEWMSVRLLHISILCTYCHFVRTLPYYVIELTQNPWDSGSQIDNDKCPWAADLEETDRGFGNGLHWWSPLHWWPWAMHQRWRLWAASRWGYYSLHPRPQGTSSCDKLWRILFQRLCLTLKYPNPYPGETEGWRDFGRRSQTKEILGKPQNVWRRSNKNLHFLHCSPRFVWG